MEESARNRSLEKKIDAYVKGNLSKDQADALWAQLLEQPDYIDYLETEITLSHICQSEQTGGVDFVKDNETSYKPKPDSKRNHKWWWYSAAAAVILAAVLTSVFVTNRRANIHQWSSRKIELGLNLASAPVTRAAKQIPSPDSLLNAGFKAAIDGDITEAVEIYQLAIKKYDNPEIVAKANLNLGILQYNMLKYKSSIQYFNKAVTHAGRLKLLKERAYWYMGNAYINTGELKDAKEAVTNAHSIGKIYSKQESKLIKRLDRTLKNEKKDRSDQD